MMQADGGVHEHWMRRCLALAERGAGRVSPNPMVGALLVGADGQVLGEGWHEAYGGPHAERNAVADAGQRHGPESLRAATLYVNLEPCNHHGKTPPCTDVVLEKGIPRIVVGMVDPFPKVAGRGIARLREHGVDVVTGVLERECRRLNEAFVHHVATGRPLVTLKVAQTLDGRVATATGDARWISGEASRRLVHRWRSVLDGVLVGAGTAAADDPALTVRAVEGRQPVRIVLDRTGALAPGLKLFSDAHADRTIAITGEGAAPAYEEKLAGAGGRVVRMPERDGHVDLPPVLGWLGREGGRDGLPMQSLLVEAGPGLSSALFREDLVDRYFLFIAPKLVGDGVPVLHLPGIARMADALTFAESQWEQVGEDLLFKGYRQGFAD
ncbi:MAG TPA: bifunctional diaminohydroxyphosphoribosylaminopyrimidine deaminase/5-amino-6-(5-phosphoribosylamino)uracil reductase RibD [Rhodothermales bacterium]|nr:bifunctional diaminohydroxyphosphoribosylaminopyrimidine deaminase/5-amino-6-(5-phosphoribosylamino)uracil reductase RibD [Rhodothermales bacterium]